MTRSRFAHRSRPCDSSLLYDPMGRHWIPTGAARAYHQPPRLVEKSGEDCVVWIREQECREILGQLAKAATVERPTLTSEAFRLGATKDAMCRSLMAVVAANLVDESRIIDTLGVWKVFQDQMGLVDCTYGLTEVWQDVQRGLRRRRRIMAPYVGDSARGEQEQPQKPWPEWLILEAPPPDPSAPVLCQLWFCSVGKEVYAQANAAFERVFLSTARVREVMAHSRLMSFYLWRLIISVMDLSLFYERMIEALFAKEVSESFLIAKCITRLQEKVPFLISIAAHFAPGPDGLPVRGYCVRLWPTKAGSIDQYFTPTRAGAGAADFTLPSQGTGFMEVEVGGGGGGGVERGGGGGGGRGGERPVPLQQPGELVPLGEEGRRR